ncbi:MAG TPA: hypothetical protein VGR00_11470, partial [Thermoanaerobaculia bacterium]|nr:hypothetical protein [Thermoanaerobaculia bacterium]
MREDARESRIRWAGSLALLASCIVASGSVSLLLGQDVNWDLKNYHFYGPYAFLHGRLGWDVAPAQVQSYLNPVVDLPFYFFATAIPSARVVAFLMAASTGVAVFFLVRILLSSFRTSDRRDGWVRFAAALAIGVTGAAGVSTIGSTMGEWPSVAMLLAAIYVVLRSDTVSRARLFAAGALVGAGAGLKPTYVIYGAAFFVAIFALIPKGSRVRDAATYSGAALLGFAATTGFWCATLQRHLGSPVFPILNGVVKSPFWEPISLRDVRFLPRTLGQAIAYPFLFARKSHLVAEVSFVDYRIAALFVLAVLCGANWMVRRGRAQGETIGAELRARRFLIVFSAVAYVAWLVSFGIYRYLVPLEILSGLLIVSGVVFLAGNGAMSRFAVLAATVAIVASTRPMNWGRKPFDGAFFQVSVPDLSQALVLIASSNPVSSDPVSYLIPFFPEETRFISPSNNFLRLGQR